MKKYQKYKNNSQKQLHKSSKGKTALAVTGISILALGTTYGVFHKQINSGVESVVDRLKNPTQTTTKNDNNLQITALQNEINIKNEEIKKAVNQIEALINEKNQALEQQAALKEDVQDKTSTINSLKNELTQKQTAIDEKNAALSEKEAALTEKQAALTKLQEDYDALEISNAEYQSQKAQLEESITALTNEKTTLVAEKTQLASELETVNATLTQKQTELDDTTIQLNTVTENYNSLNNQVSTLQADIESKTQELNNLQARYDVLQSSYEELQEKYDNQTSELEDLKNNTPKVIKNTELLNTYIDDVINKKADISLNSTGFTSFAGTTPTNIKKKNCFNSKSENLTTLSNGATIAMCDLNNLNVSGEESIHFGFDKDNVNAKFLLSQFSTVPDVLKLSVRQESFDLYLHGLMFSNVDKTIVIDLSDCFVNDIHLVDFESLNNSNIYIILPIYECYTETENAELNLSNYDSYYHSVHPKWCRRGYTDSAYANDVSTFYSTVESLNINCILPTSYYNDLYSFRETHEEFSSNFTYFFSDLHYILGENIEDNKAVFFSVNIKTSYLPDIILSFNVRLGELASDSKMCADLGYSSYYDYIYRVVDQYVNSDECTLGKFQKLSWNTYHKLTVYGDNTVFDSTNEFTKPVTIVAS